jgi:hypothetical protein
LEDLRKLQEACPYRLDRRTRGLNIDIPLGPDCFELHAHISAGLAGGVQSRKDCVSHTRVRLIPVGLPPEIHLVMGCATESPLQRPVELADDLDFAVRTVVEQGANIQRWRRKQWRLLETHLRKYGGPPDKIARSSSSLRVAAHLDPVAIEVLRYSIQWPDSSLASTTMFGAQIIGKLPTFGVFREAQVNAACSAKELLDDSADWLQELLRSPASAFERALNLSALAWALNLAAFERALNFSAP